MAHPTDMRNLALFCDFENIALGVRDAHYDRFDIRMVVDALDFGYTKPQVDTFVIISGDSDFSPWSANSARTGRP